MCGQIKSVKYVHNRLHQLHYALSNKLQLTFCSDVSMNEDRYNVQSECQIKKTGQWHN